MSEQTAEAYFIDRAAIQQVYGSRDSALLQRIVRGLHFVELEPRFTVEPFRDAIADIVNGTAKAGYPFHHSYAVWLVVEAIAPRRSARPTVLPPFMPLTDAADLAADEGLHAVADFMSELEGTDRRSFPIALPAWAERPGFAFRDGAGLPALEREAAVFRAAIANNEPWTKSLDEPQDLLQLLGWIEEAVQGKQSLLVVLDGSL